MIVGEKIKKIRNLMTKKDLELILLSKNSNIAWNPSLKGVKSEDTILVKEEENEILSYDPKWPGEEIECCGRKIYRPNIMIR